MTARGYFYTLIVLLILGIISTLYVNYKIDFYGLFATGAYQPRYVVNDEKRTKYLFSFNHIPRYFDGVLVGPSYSDHIQTEMVSPYRIYNASLNAGNISELLPLVQNVTRKDGAIKVVILGLHPYLTKDSGTKDGQISEKSLSGALGSLQLVESYLQYSRARLLNRPTSLSSEYGSLRIVESGNAESVIAEAAEKLREDSSYYITRDQVAMDELAQLVQTITESGVELIVYYHPIPYEMMTVIRDEYDEYKAEIQTVLPESVLIQDYNTAEYEFFTKDYSFYSDAGHLSESGQTWVATEIQRMLDAVLGE